MTHLPRTIFCAFSLITLALPGSVTNTTVRSMMRVWDATDPSPRHCFSLTGTIHTVQNPIPNAIVDYSFVFDDGELLIPVFKNTHTPILLRPGDRVAISGLFGVKPFAYGNEPYASAKTIDVLASGPAPEPVPKALSDLSSVRDNLRTIRTSGFVIDWRASEDDPDYLCLTLKDGPATMPVLIPAQDAKSVDQLLETRVSVIGTFNRGLQSVRRYARPLIVSTFQNIRVIEPPPAPDAIPVLERKIYLTPQDILSLGKRKIQGEIIAVWQKYNLLLKDDDGRVVRVRLSQRNRLAPRAGQRVTIYGYPETDQFNIILGTATAVSCSSSPHDPEPPERLGTPSDVITPRHGGATTFKPSYYGKPVTLVGTVRSLPASGNDGNRIGLDCDGHHIRLDASACPAAAEGLELGCQIEASGVCLFDMDDYDAQTDTPHVSGLTLVLRAKEDISVLARPPWLTPMRFLVILCAMTGIIVLVLCWNHSLRVLVERRGRELARRQSETLKARLKTAERTRLATELHDAVVQNLTGAALEIRAARTALAPDNEETAPHLDIALKTINASRAELRNCIWDLRNRALEEQTIDEAIRITLQPHLGEARLLVRFNVSRRKIPDNELHNILSIIRELVINAVRHGHARTIKIAGTLDGNRILFSVEDNGQGFDPETRPGMEQGHFGLEGVIERAKTLDGTVTIESAPDKGTRVSVTVALRGEN